MTPLAPSRLGGAPVGRLDALDPLGQLAVLALRRWSDDGEAALACDLRDALGEGGDVGAAAAFDALCRACVGASRRPLARHGAGCPCLGADEARFAALVREAACGEREDALMIACLMARHDLAPALVGLAQAAGLALRRALVSRPRATLH